ncbi:MAG TPA: UPF0182 family protein [Actinomycetota bacterium]|nr:UPF0182 family protein [Actinomycetota bacterium]
MATRQVGARPRIGRARAFWLILILVVLAAAASSRFYTDVLWFQEVGFESVLWKSLGTQFAVGAAVALIVGLVVFGNLLLAQRLAPAYPLPPRGLTGRLDPAQRYREVLGPIISWLRIGVSVAIGLLTGLAAAGRWQTYLLWQNRVSFGANDPQFSRDIGFYVFELPFYDLALNWLWVALMAGLLTSIAAHYFHGSLRPDVRPGGIAPGALAHLSVFLGALALVKAAQYWIGRYQLNFSTRGAVEGATYTDVHAQLPALTLLTIISIISALLFLANIRVRKFVLPLAAVGIWVLTAFLAGGVWPWWVQRFSVAPQEPQREGPFIERNIEATRAAFGLDQVGSIPYAARSELTAESIRANGDLLENVRLWDPGVLKTAYSQLQAIRTYYEFPDVDIDRYEIDGRQRQVLLSARELHLLDLPEKSETWSNLHLQYTHGFGLVASLANESSGAGQPQFLSKDLPGSVVPGAESLELEQPRLYYGEAFESQDYSVVGSKQPELDYPLLSGAERNSYDGEGGIPVAGLLRRLAFAIREGDPNLVLSSLIDADSRILIYRNVRDRVRRVAPFLELDHDPYVVAADGRLTWLIDAYTSTRFYPYSQKFDASDIVSGEETGNVTGLLRGEINYVRNSVKVAVDAYDGTMTFYVVDDEDPLLQAWSKAFPDLFSRDEPPTALQEHFRYPEDLFKLQSEVYLTYHMTDPQDFYLKEDEWDVPSVQVAPGSAERVRVAPTYLLIGLPGEVEDEFLLTRPFTPRARNNMIAFLAARSDPGHYGELVTLQFPRQIQVPGPLQIDNLINQDVEISETLTLLGQRGSTVAFGSLVTLPIGESILYVQPLFVTAEDVGIPELKKVVMVHGQDVVMADSFEEALTDLFDLDITPDPTPSPDEDDPQPSDNRGLARVLARAAELYAQAQEALEAGDFAEYGRLIEELGDLLTSAAQGGARR